MIDFAGARFIAWSGNLLISFSNSSIWSPIECVFIKKKSSLTLSYRSKRNVTVIHWTRTLRQYSQNKALTSQNVGEAEMRMSGAVHRKDN